VEKIANFIGFCYLKPDTVHCDCEYLSRTKYHNFQQSSLFRALGSI
jgi:hypothetical protein